jgi:hypothetical protein
MSLSLLIALLVILKPPHTDSAKRFLLPSVYLGQDSTFRMKDPWAEWLTGP